MLLDSLKYRFRPIRTFLMKRKCRNKDFTLITNNCVGGCVLHDLQVRFDTPTINLFFRFPDYISFLQNIRHYMDCELEMFTPPHSVSSSYPIGKLGGDVLIDFLHYPSFEAAKKDWNRRKKRIHWDNLYVVLVERDGCTLKDLKAFDELEFKHKVALVHKPVDGIGCAFVMQGFELDEEIGNVFQYIGRWGKRVYDQFDWVKFLNQK